MVESIELSWAPVTGLLVFIASYLLVIFEDRTHLRKSIPMIIAAGVMWILTALAPDIGPAASEHLRESILEYAELFLFILAAVSFVNTLEERRVFDVLRSRLFKSGMSLRGLFWATGAIAFCMSPIADNLTTTLVLGAVAIWVGQGNPRFVVPACINIVVAANAGGAFSPFGDITTLMVWQRGVVEFGAFFRLFLPSLVNWLIPAALMAMSVPNERPAASGESVSLRPGARVVLGLFIATIAGTVLLYQLLDLPAVIGMMTGFGALHLYGYFLRRRLRARTRSALDAPHMLGAVFDDDPSDDGFDVFTLLARVEWDTLMFFYGVMLCVGALDALGFLDLAVHGMYGSWGPTAANVVVGLASAVLDNIPLMAGVLAASPEMNTSQWLLVTLTAGVGGSLLSIGSAAGVALMGQAHGVYTFKAHLRWVGPIALGFAASVGLHLLLNGS